MLWLVFGLMSLAAVLAVIRPFVRNRQPIQSGNDVAVYRDQLEELERDLAAGLIAKAEADTARLEISRRLLAADAAGAGNAEGSTTATWQRPAIGVLALLLLTLGPGLLYLRLGTPGLASSTPATERGATKAQRSIEDLVLKVERHLQSEPKDGRGWEVLGPVYMQLGRYADSANAWRNALLLLGENAERQAHLGEALFAGANGVVTEEANHAWTRALALDKRMISARYYLGIAAEQDGHREKAIEIWRELIAEAPADGHWVSDVRAAIARVEAAPAASSPGPTMAQAAAAAKLAPDQQSTMIRGMVDGLAARLKQDGSDLEGWVKLVRSYKILGEPDQAKAAIRDAQQAFAGDPARREKLDLALKELESGTILPVAASAPGAHPEAAPQQHDGEADGMVARLAERMRNAPSDADGWIMLTRSYIALGENQKAAATIKEARAALVADAARLQHFNDALQRFRIDARPTAQ